MSVRSALPGTARNQSYLAIPVDYLRIWNLGEKLDNNYSFVSGKIQYDICGRAKGSPIFCQAQAYGYFRSDLQYNSACKHQFLCGKPYMTQISS